MNFSDRTTDKLENIVDLKLTRTTTQKPNIDRTWLASWLFLIGSSIFILDGILELTEGISIHAIFHNSASWLFTIGSIFFLLETRDK
jgi:hypothetical protein